MASRNPRGQGGPASQSSSTRQNEYFVPRDGIDREVISADICRYLGNDALVRPGHYENPQNGQVVQGYYITAYRNLTTAMIEDLKADSARWDNERRAQTSRNTSGGIPGSRDGSGGFARVPSDSHPVQYRSSETHQSRQHHGPTEAPYQTDPMYSRDNFDGPQYPGTGAPGYTGANYPQQPTYAPPSGGGNAYGNYPQAQQSPPPDARFGNAQPMTQGYQASQETPYIATGANMAPRYGGANDPYAGSRMVTSAPPQSTAYTTSGPPPPSGFPNASPSPYQYQNQAHPPSAGAQQSYGSVPPQDPYYGRASPAGSQNQRSQGFPAPSPQNNNDRNSRPPPPR